LSANDIGLVEKLSSKSYNTNR